METFAEIMFFISLLIFIYFICRGIFKLIKGAGSKQSFKYGLIALAASFLFVIVGLIANPVKNTASSKDTIAHSKKISTSKIESPDKSSNKKHSNKSSSKRSNSKKTTLKKTSSSKKKPSENNSDTKKTVAKKSSSKNKASTKKTKKKVYSFNKIKIGMTKSQVISIMGKPTDESSSTLMYGSDDLDFENDKLFDGSPDKIHKAAIKKDKAEAKESSKKRANESELKSFAKVFGQKDVETLQKYVGSAYSSIETSQGMAYGWKTDYGMLYRLDDSSTGITHVYKDGLGDSGTQLYVGQTLKQKQRRNYYHYN
ncbi:MULTISPECIES: hypothetical protein [Lactiplantibacillus]|uniref:hypothetical protein n=1 Tax=Lactiplantibacillus TaxID=2767842 RepID=UPI0006C1753F|nr:MULTISPECIES: hypothetical protein [Lactiplantibacillus]AYC71695.1 hypothetical protein D5289_06540 [Lactiplantibacillus plantarum]KON40124.1 hypothetical protein ADS73_06490 [Lactiplantibacillus plantarum]MBW1621542.1 outer membrane protein assembly factor BamE [Lactiplantibacillus plantarum]MCG0654759.1 outer membrane protein assembly factor BamE [Lactiplantibacillus plantarum]MCT3229700.1 hypothetical protein [Lactiplantibacillus plantarum]